MEILSKKQAELIVRNYCTNNFIVLNGIYFSDMTDGYLMTIECNILHGHDIFCLSERFNDMLPVIRGNRNSHIELDFYFINYEI